MIKGLIVVLGFIFIFPMSALAWITEPPSNFNYTQQSEPGTFSHWYINEINTVQRTQHIREMDQEIQNLRFEREVLEPIRTRGYREVE